MALSVLPFSPFSPCSSLWLLNDSSHITPDKAGKGSFLLTATAAAAADPLLIRLPSLDPVPLRLRLPLFLPSPSIDPPSDDDHIRPTLQHRLPRSPILLSHLVPLDTQPNPRRQHQEILLVLLASLLELIHPLLGDKADDKVAVSTSHSNGLESVGTGGEGSFGGHLGEEEEASGEGQADGGEPGDDAVSREGVGVCHVCPGGDLVGAGGVLEGDGVA
jgi:hypothetical protein